MNNGEQNLTENDQELSAKSLDETNNKNKISKGIIFALLAALLYALNIPLSKVMLNSLSPYFMAGFLYIGAGVGMAISQGVAKMVRGVGEENIKFKRNEYIYVFLMVILDVAAPILLMLGLQVTNAENASLLNNFEIVATAVIAMAFFKEKVGLRLWLSIAFITLASIILSVNDFGSGLNFDYGALLILGACLCWGLENNCTRMLSNNSPAKIVSVKGIFSGLGAIAIAFIMGERVQYLWTVFAALGLGFLSYGMSIFFYVYAQRYIGSTRTSVFYAVSPFIGVALSLLIFAQVPPFSFIVALLLMGVGAVLASGISFKKSKHIKNNEK